MQRVIRIVVLGMLLVVSAPAVSAYACPGGTSHSRTDSGLTIGAEHCEEPADDQSSNQGGDGGSDESAGTSQESSGPTRRTVSDEEYWELWERCRRGPSLDALSIQCVAALPDREGDAPAPDAPDAPAVTVEQVRESAIAQIDMGAPDIGASPCLTAADACRGTVGVPVWLWVGDGTGSLPSDSGTATAGPYTITATAKVSKVKWSLGDGQSVACHGVGTKYDPQRDGWSSPDCGFDAGWKQSGTYTLTASYVWEISFSGDATGSMTETLSSTEQVTVGELQSVATTG